MDPGPALAWRSPLFLIAASLSTVLWMMWLQTKRLTWMPWIKFLAGVRVSSYGYCTVIWWIFPLLFLCTFSIYYRLHLTANTYRGFGGKNRCKTIQKHFTEYDISSVCVRFNFHYAVSCTRFPAVRYCTNMGQMLFLTCFQLVFCALGSFRYGGFIIDLYRFCIDFSSIFVVGFRGQMQAVIPM